MWPLLFVLFFLKTITCAPNFVVVLTDDQDLLLNGLVWRTTSKKSLLNQTNLQVPMNKTLQLLANNGATFQNAVRWLHSLKHCSQVNVLVRKFPNLLSKQEHLPNRKIFTQHRRTEQLDIWKLFQSRMAECARAVYRGRNFKRGRQLHHVLRWQIPESGFYHFANISYPNKVSIF